MTNELQAEADELNRVRDFDLDSWLDEVESPHRTQTVNTRGDLLAEYGRLTEERGAVLQSLAALAETLPDDEDKSATLADEGGAAAMERFEVAKERIAALDERLSELTDTYARNRATFVLAAIDPEKRARISAEHADHKPKIGTTANTETLRLFLAAVQSITVVRDGQEIAQRLTDWTPARLEKFLQRIGDGQAALLWDAYLGTAVGDVTPPFSHASSSGAPTSTF
ncbi:MULTISPECIES: hypothetical protein [unclassified Microbacterium]|uniref:hypothetical protein n=1 Tax=unclassified Microbacterium TaxID=2609290 RepID=UPI00301A93DD